MNHLFKTLIIKILLCIFKKIKRKLTRELTGCEHYVKCIDCELSAKKLR